MASPAEGGIGNLGIPLGAVTAAGRGSFSSTYSGMSGTSSKRPSVTSTPSDESFSSRSSLTTSDNDDLASPSSSTHSQHFPLASPQSLHPNMPSTSPSTTFDPHQPLLPPTLPPVKTQPTPYEGSITIDTNPQRYLISAQLDGFRVEDITIAVKSVSPSSSASGGGGSQAGRRSSTMSDTASVRSFASGSSGGSRIGLDAIVEGSQQVSRSGDDYAAGAGVLSSPVMSLKTALGQGPPRRGRSEGKVVHLVADRWGDAGEWRREGGMLRGQG